MTQKTKIAVISIIIVQLATATNSFGQQIKIDHIICVVKDLNKSINYYSGKGFTIKKGSLHKNGLLNAHIKFENKSSFELMSLKGEATDNLAKNYKQLLKEGEGGVFIAVTGIKTNEMMKRLTLLNIQHKTVRGKYWNYITFSDTSSLAHFFFIEYHIDIKDKASQSNHANSTTKINKVYVEGTRKVIRFLQGIGLKKAQIFHDLKYSDCSEFNTKTGRLIIIPATKIKDQG